MNVKIIFLLVVSLLLVVFVSKVSCGPTRYRIKIDPADLTGVEVEIVSHPEGRIVRLAMGAHPEYDDRYYRYIRNFSAESGGRAIAFSKPEDSVWQVDGVNGDVTVRYRVTLVPNERQWQQTWKPHLSPTGGMVGDLHMLMYIVGQERHPALLTLDMPAGWKAVSGLEPTDDPKKFFGTVELLLDSPVLVGDVKEWKFTAGGVQHSVAIWSPKDSKPFQAEPIVDGIKKLANQAIANFGPPPYPRYAFLIENGGSTALEHTTSVNLGLEPDPSDFFQELAHEYLHVWNLMDVRPRERVGLRYSFAEPTGVLWFNEGATIMFADLLLRQAGLPGADRTRINRLESLLARYLSSPSYSELSADLVSRGDSHPALLGNSWAGTHLQGEVISNMLDLKLRSATDGRNDLTTVLRLLAARFDSGHGITNSDIEEALVKSCGCSMHDFFKTHIYGAKQLDFGEYLALIGLRAEVSWVTADGADGSPSTDLRVGPLSSEGEMRVRITNPNSTWAKSGLITGDKVESADGRPIASWQDFRNWLVTLKIGHAARVRIIREGEAKTVEVPIKPYQVPNVRLIELPNATEKQIRLRDAWAKASVPRVEPGSAKKISRFSVLHK